MGRKKRRNRSAAADLTPAAAGGGVVAGKRSVTENLPPAGGATGGGGAVPSLLARPEAADAAYEVHQPPPVGLARWFEDVFGEEEKSPWSWSADGFEHEKTKQQDGATSTTKVIFDADEKKLGVSTRTEDKDGKGSMSIDVMRGKARWKQTGPDGKGSGVNVNLGGGELGGEWSTSQDTKSDGTKTKDEHRAKVSVIASEEDGVGVMGTSTSKNVVDDGANRKEKETALRAGFTDKGAVLGGSMKEKWKNQDGWEAQRKVSADGAFLVEVIPPRPGEDPTCFRVVTTLRAGVDFKGHGAKNLLKKEEGGDDAESDDNKVKLSAGAEVGGEMVYTRRMSAAEAKAYLADLDSPPPARRGALPEYAMLDKLRTVVTGDGHETAAAASLLGSAGSARALAPGDSVSLSLHVGAEGELGGDVQGRGLGAGFEVGGSFEYVRNVTVSRTSGGKVKVLVGFEHESTSNAGASATVMSSKLAGGTERASSDGEAREYVLDPGLPDYDACYAKILGVWSRDGLHALDQDPAVLAHRTRAILESANDDATKGEVSLLGLGIKGKATRIASTSLVIDEKGNTSGDFTGGQKADLGFGAGGARPLQRNQSDTATASVDEDGQLTAELQSKKSRTDFVDTIVNAPAIVGKWLGFDADKHKEGTGSEVMTGLLAKSPGERLAQLLSTTYTRLSGYHLGESDVDTIIAHAADEDRWLHCARRPGAVIPMRILRAQLRSQEPDPEVTFDPDNADQTARAIKLAHARAIADFMRNAGSAGMEAMEYVLRRWGESATRESDGPGLGARYDWPESLASQHRRYDALTAEIRGIEGTYAGLVGKPGARAAADKTHARIRNELYVIREAVRSSTDIHSERARAEMLDDMARYETVEVTAYREVGAQIDATPASGDAGATPAVEDPAPPPLPARIAPARIRTLTRELADLKTREVVMLARARALVALRKQADALHELHEVRELYDFWQERSQELRDAYSWVDDARRPGPVPDVEAMITLWKAAGGDARLNDWPAIWRARWERPADARPAML